MVSIQKGPFSSSRPEFTDIHCGSSRAETSGILRQNSLLQKCAPSNSSLSILVTIRRIIRKILQYFIVFHPSRFENRLIRMVQVQAGDGNELRFGEFSSHFCKFLENDSHASKALISSLNLVEKEHGELMALSMDDSDKGKQKLKMYQEKKIAEFAKLESGQTRLFALKKQLDPSVASPLFAVVTKTGDTFTLRFVGTGSELSLLEHNGKPYTLAGKEKVYREVIYKNVPKDLMLNQKWMEGLYCPSGVNDDVLQEELKQLESYKTKIETLSSLTTKTDKTAKLFWNLVHAFEPPNTAPHVEKQLKIRAELFNLFEFFASHRYELRAQSKEHHYMRKLFASVSGEVLRAHAKGIITDQDLVDIRKELEIIDSTMKRAEDKALPPLSCDVKKTERLFKGVSLDDLKAHSSPALQKSMQIQEVEVAVSSRGASSASAKKLSEAQPNLPHDLPKVVLNKYRQIATKDEALIAFRGLYDKTQGPDSKHATKEFLRFFHEVPMMLFTDYYFQPKKSNSFWWSCTHDEQLEMMEKINVFTERFTQDPTCRAYDQNTLEAFCKMTYLTAVFEAEALGPAEGYLEQDLDRLFNTFYPHARDSQRSIYQTESSNFARLPMRVDPATGLQAAHDIRQVRHYYSYYRLNDARKDNPITPHPHAKKQLDLLSHLSGSDDRHHTFCRDAREYSSLDAVQRLLKPISNPYLLALYRQVDTRIHWKPSEGRREKVEAVIGWMSPEAVQTDPEGLFGYFYDELQEVNNWFAELRNEDPERVPSFAITYSDEDKRHLLRLLRTEKVQPEAVNFIKNAPHLLREPDARNFLDAIFFHPDLINVLYDHEYQTFAKELPSILEQEMLAHRQKYNRLRESGTTDHELIKGEFEVLLFLHEIHEKLKGCYKYAARADSGDILDLRADTLLRVSFQDTRQELQDLLQLSKQNPLLNKTSGYIERILLRKELEEGTLSGKELAKVLERFMRAFSSNTAPYLLDPHFESFLHAKWQEIMLSLSDTGEFEKAFNAAAIHGFLDHLTLSKNLSLSDAKWVYEGNYHYTNGVYRVDLHDLSFTLCSQSLSQEIERLPKKIFQSEGFAAQFQTLPEEPFVVTKIKEQNITVYAFKDASGVACRVEVNGNAWTLYKKSTGTSQMWLQAIPASILSGKKNEQKVQAPPSGICGILKGLYGHVTDSKEPVDAPLPALFQRNVYIDPADSKKGYILDDTGVVLFRFTFSQTKNGLVLDKVYDDRKGSEEYRLNVASDFSTSGLDFLHRFENPENIVLWSQDQKVKKVELPRYGLTFSINNHNQLISLDPQFEGYFVVANPRASDRKYLASALVLQHPDPTKPKKILLPASSALSYRNKALQPKIAGFGYVMRFFEKVKEFIGLLRGKIPPQPLMETELGVGGQNKISYTTFDLRAYTEEICLPQETKVFSTLELCRHYIAAREFSRAQECMKGLTSSFKSLDSKSLQALVDFVQKKSGTIQPTPGEAAIKYKLLIELKRALKKDQQKKAIVSALNTLLLEQGKAIVAAGRALANELKLTQSELVELAVVARKIDREFYEKHLKVLFVDDGTQYALGQENALPDMLDKAVASWKESRLPRNRNDEISRLEKRVLPDERLSEDKLAYNFPRLARGQEVYRLYKPYEVDHLFRFDKEMLPTLDLKRPNRPLSACEEEGLTSLEQDVSAYKEVMKDTFTPVLKAQKKELDRFVGAKIIPLRDEQDRILDSKKKEIELLITASTDNKEQLEIYAKKKTIASFDEMRMAFGLNKLGELQKQKRLPDDLDIQKLSRLLQDYFEALVRKNALDAATAQIAKIEHAQEPAQKKELSKALYELLTVQCVYDASKDPRFLVFEAQQFINFKSLDAGLDQLDLLQMLVSNPYAIVQAPTGAGKTSVLSVLQSLLKPNGDNLVIQKVLTPLYGQTYEQYRQVLGNLFGISIYPLRFHMKMRLTKTAFERTTDDKGVVKKTETQVSIFKLMYEELLSTIENRGCVLTDYKSLPLLEEKFWRLSQELADMQDQDVEPKPILIEHHKYLRKILLVLENKAVENMDEFDQPNRPIQKIQLDLGVGSHRIPPFMIEKSLEIYKHLLESDELGLKDNIQQDVSAKIRGRALEQAARKMAASIALELNDKSLEHALFAYFLGLHEEVLPKIERCRPAIKDAIALCQRQFSLFLPLTLAQKRGSRYDRSDDGLKTVPCHNGEKTEAKFGTLLEQTNYMIQDYLQGGITQVDLVLWLKELKRKYDDAKDVETQNQVRATLQNMLTGVTAETLSDYLANPELLKKGVDEINKRPDRIMTFLQYRLSELTSSGNVISMGPQEIVDMSRAVSGTSATMGAKDSLHPQFAVDDAMNGKIRANMAYRLKKRAAINKVLPYDPRRPNDLIACAQKQKPVSAIIDGAGAYTVQGTKETAEKLLQENKELNQVGYHAKDGTISFVGAPSGSLHNTGFIFSQSHTRGTDIALHQDATALLTLADQDGLRDVCQKEGRLRKATQQYLLGMPQDANEVTTVDEEIVHAACKDAQIDAKDIFKAQVQRITATLRKEARRSLLKEESFDEFLKRFKDPHVRDLFISSAEAHYQDDGEYFKKNCHLKQPDKKPKEVLEAYRNETAQKAHRLGFGSAKELLEKIQYSDALVKRMPEKVASISTSSGEELEMELEIEQEEELEQEEQLEVSLETEGEKLSRRALGYYPVRVRDTVKHSVKDKIHPAYDARIFVRDTFLPLSREKTASLRKRKAFDDAMLASAIVRVKFGTREIPHVSPYSFSWKRHEHFIKHVTVGDNISDGDEWTSFNKFYYDLRTDTVVRSGSSVRGDFTEHLHSPEFTKIKAELKFFDGRTSGYSACELDHLRTWLRQNDPQKMKEHLLNQVLKNRYRDKVEFENSELAKLFGELISK